MPQNISQTVPGRPYTLNQPTWVRTRLPTSLCIWHSPITQAVRNSEYAPPGLISIPSCRTKTTADTSRRATLSARPHTDVHPAGRSRHTTLLLPPSPAYVLQRLGDAHPTPLGVGQDVRPACQGLSFGDRNHFVIVKPVPLVGSAADEGHVVARVRCAPVVHDRLQVVHHRCCGEDAVEVGAA